MAILASITIFILCLGGLFVLLHLLIYYKFFLSHKRLAPIAKRFYNYFYSIKGIDHLSINNYGFAPVDNDLAVYPPVFQFGIQLYKELVKNGSGYMITDKSKVVEIGCGKGAGAAYLIQKFHPLHFTGIDYSSQAIGYCKKNYPQLKNAQFICADAHAIPLPDGFADVVINVESSHIYKDPFAFFKEVNRVLQPNGKFLFTDYRYLKHCSILQLEKEIKDSGFLILHKRDITQNIYDSCIGASPFRKNLIEEASPPFLKKYFGHYSGLKGSKKHLQFGNGEIVYFIYHLEKQS
ncbi:MAG: class I SAM-dependent methyltransferase [Chitinophagaceae bacterium]